MNSTCVTQQLYRVHWYFQHLPVSRRPLWTGLCPCLCTFLCLIPSTFLVWIMCISPSKLGSVGACFSKPSRPPCLLGTDLGDYHGHLCSQPASDLFSLLYLPAAALDSTSFPLTQCSTMAATLAGLQLHTPGVRKLAACGVSARHVRMIIMYTHFLMFLD